MRIYLNVAGWGRLSTGGDFPDILQKIYLRPITNYDCKVVHEMKNVGDGHICTLNKRGQGVCHVSSSC